MGMGVFIDNSVDLISNVIVICVARVQIDWRERLNKAKLRAGNLESDHGKTLDNYCYIQDLSYH